MGYDVRVEFYRNPSDQRHLKMLDAVDALFEAGVKEPPKEMETYFGTDSVVYARDLRQSQGDRLAYLNVTTMDLPPDAFRQAITVNDDFYDIDLKRLPDDVGMIRIENSW